MNDEDDDGDDGDDDDNYNDDDDGWRRMTDNVGEWLMMTDHDWWRMTGDDGCQIMTNDDKGPEGPQRPFKNDSFATRGFQTFL